MDGETHQQVWRHTYGQPRGFDARFHSQRNHVKTRSRFLMFTSQTKCQGTSMTSVMELPWMRRATISSSEGKTCFTIVPTTQPASLEVVNVTPSVIPRYYYNIINRSSIKNMIKYNIYSLFNYATCPSLVLGMSTIMRKPMLMGGAAIPGWGFFRRSSLICLLSCVLCLFFVVRNVCILVFLLGVIPCGHLTKWRNCFQWGLWWQGGEQCR